MNTLHHGDCLDILPTLEAGSVDMILCDLPYGTTALAWDSIIPLEPLWKEYKRLIKPNGAIVLFGSQPFTSALVMSNPEWFRYEWIWEKSKSTGFLDANRKPLKIHDNICVFYRSLPTYNPQKAGAKRQVFKHEANRAPHYGNHSPIITTNGGKSYPNSIIYTSNAHTTTLHPTQKPVPLLAYLIRTYTNKGDTVLDNAMGSGSTGVACIEEGRSFIGIEKDAGYFEIAKTRIHEAETAPRTMRMELTA